MIIRPKTNMEKLFTKAEDLASNIKDYVNARIDALKLNAAEKTSGIIANFVARIMVIIFLFFFVGLGSIALSLVLGLWIGNAWIGFLIVGLFYLLLALIVWATRDKLIRLPVMNAIIQQMFKVI